VSRVILVLLLNRDAGGARITTIGGARSLQRSREIQNDEKTRRRKDAREDIAKEKQKVTSKRQKSKNAPQCT